MDTDYHIHTASTDGPILEYIRQAAVENELREIGVVDHCNVSPGSSIGYEADMFSADEPGLDDSPGYFSAYSHLQEESIRSFVEDNDHVYRPGDAPEPFSLVMPNGNILEDDEGYWKYLDVEERPLIVWRGVEMDYEPEAESFIDSFLEARNFDFGIGSVHYLDDRYVPKERNFPEMSSREAEDFTEEYFDKMVSLVDSELFDILAHPGLIERNPVFEPHVARSHYEEVADALRSSAMVTEINGKSLERQEPPYPVDIMHDKGVNEFTLGTDTHRAEEVGRRSPLVGEKLEQLDAKPLRMEEVLERSVPEKRVAPGAV